MESIKRLCEISQHDNLFAIFLRLLLSRKATLSFPFQPPFHFCFLQYFFNSHLPPLICPALLLLTFTFHFSHFTFTVHFYFSLLLFTFTFTFTFTFYFYFLLFTFYCLLLLFTFADGQYTSTARGLTGGFPGVAPQLSSDRSSSSSSRLAKAARAQCCADHRPGRT